MNNILKTKLNVWKNFSKHCEFLTIVEFYNRIKNDLSLKSIISLIESSSKEEADSLKKSLDGITFSGIFDENSNRAEKGLKDYTGLMVLDLDKLEVEEVNPLFEKVTKIPQTLMAFLSPSGKGIKIIVATDNIDSKKHTEVYKQVMTHYESLLNVKFDEKTCDVARLCFFSYDPNAYLNFYYKTFEIENIEVETSINNNNTKELQTMNTDSVLKLMAKVERFTENRVKFTEGGRNNFIYLLSKNSNKYGYPKQIVKNYCTNKYSLNGFTSEEIENAVDSAYNKCAFEFGESKKYLTQDELVLLNAISNIDVNSPSPKEVKVLEMNTIKQDDEVVLNDTPIMGDFIKTNMPNFIREITYKLKSEREKDVFILGILTSLSSVINVRGFYGGREYYSPLYSFISAPPASGKGALEHCRKFILPIHKRIKDESQNALESYNYQMEQYEESKKKGDKNLKKPKRPPYKTLLIPANCSSSKIIKHISENQRASLMIESEADTLANSFKMQHGDFSEVLRKAFEHEFVSLSRVSNSENIEIDNPKLGIALSGTPEQFKKLITSVENGLFSRFIYYVFQATPQWLNVSPKKDDVEPLANLIKRLGEDFSNKMVELHQNHVEFEFTDEQWETFNFRFNDITNQYSCFIDEAISSNIFRMGVSIFRISMTLSVIRYIENGEKVPDKVICTDLDFKISMELLKVFVKHLSMAFNLVNNKVMADKDLKVLLALLPNEFDRKTAMEIASSNGINYNERTIDKKLTKLIEFGYLIKPRYNRYEKNVQSNSEKQVA